VNETGGNSDSEEFTRGPLEGVRILHVTLNGPAHNPRMLKENRTYLEAGAEVSALILGAPQKADTKTSVDGTTLIAYRLSRPESIRAKLGVQAWFRSWTFCSHIRRAVAETTPDVIQAHDMFVAGSVFASQTDIPVILDLHENYPAATEQYRTAYPTIKRAVFATFQHRRRMDRIEHKYIARSATVFTVTEEATDRVRLKHAGVRVITVPNVERRDFGTDMLGAASNHGGAPEEAEPLRLVYTGGFEVLRGLHTVVRALSALDRDDIHLDLIGARDSDYVRSLRNEVAKLGLDDRVTLHDWIPREEVTSRIDRADLTLVPHEANDQTNATIPHKLFQYMARGKPVLVSSCPPLAKHVRAADAGFVFTAGDANDCARTIAEALERRDDLTRIGENGRRYVTENMNWELVSEPALIDALMELRTAGSARAASASSLES